MARLGLLLYFPALGLHAQVPSVGPVLDVESLREAPVLEAIQSARPISPLGGVTPQAALLPPKEVLPPLRSVRMTVTRYRVLGVGSALADTLERLLDTQLGEGKTHEDLSQAAGLLTRHLQAHEGFYLAYAYLPEQALQQGEVLIHVLPGELAAVQLQGNELGPLRAHVQGVLNQLEPGKPLYTADLERVSFLLNDLPGWRFDLGIQPGPRVGSVVLQVQAAEEAHVLAQLGWDNQGSRAIGRERVRAALRFSPSWVAGDSLSLSGLNTLGDDLSFAAVHYAVPLGHSGWRVGWSYSDLAYTLNPSPTQERQTGDAQTWSLHALYPWVRARNRNLYGLLQFEHGAYSDHRRDGALQEEKSLDSLEATLSGDWRDFIGGGGLNTAELGLRTSLLDVRQASAMTGSPDDTHWRVKYNLSRLQTLIPERLQAWLSLRGQQSTEGLDSVEHCALGGATAVRAFAQGEAEGHSCTLLSAEFRFLLPRAAWMPGLGDVSFSLFQDWGRVRNAGTSEFLSGYGVGVQMAGGEGRGKAVPWTAQLLWAAPVQQGAVAAAYETRRVQGSLRFQF